MKNVFKKFILTFFVTVLCFAFSVIVSAENYNGECGTEGDNITWTLDTETGVLEISGYGKMEEIVFGAHWRRYDYDIKKVVVNGEIENIGSGAFRSCQYLTSVSLPESLISIDSNAFNVCLNLSSVYIPENVETIGDYAFGWCNITEISIPDSVTSIGSCAFMYCESLKEIEIPYMVEHIGSSAFSGCKAIKAFTVDDNNEYYSTDQYGVLFNKDKTELIRYPAACAKKLYKIPDTVLSVLAGSFGECDNLTDITIPNSVKNIGGSAFQGCDSLININIPDSVTYIDSSAFYECNALEYIEIPGSIVDLSWRIFKSCDNLKEIKLSDGLISIGEYAFEDCVSLENIVIPETVTTINNSAFSNCVNLKSVKMSSGVKTIDIYAFDGCENLTYLYYVGNESQWNKVSVRNYNSPLYKAYRIYICPHEKVVAQEQINPTCTAKGYTAGEKCESCNKWLSGHEEIPAINHINAKEYSQVNASCTEQGFTAGIYCEDCQKWISGHNTILSLGHCFENYVSDDNATCTKDGTKTAKCNNGCGTRDTVTDEDTATGHSFKRYLSDNNATCTKDGTKTARCENNCGEKYTVTDLGSKKLHTSDKGTVIKKATYTSTGTKIYKCTACKVTLKTEEITRLTLSKASGLKASSIGTTSLKFTWNKVTGAEKYEVYYSTNGKSWKKVTTNKNSVTVKKLKTGTTYKVKVRAVAGNNKGSYSSVLTTSTKPSKVTLTKLTSGKKKLTAQWKTISGATGYEAVYSTSKKFTTKTTKKTTIKKQSTKKTTLKKLKSGKKYYVKVRAYKVVNGKKIYGAYSSVKTVKIK